MQEPERTIPENFQFDEVRVDASIGQISGPGGKAHLEPRLMAVLQRLASCPGELVTRSELLADIWPGGEVYDEALTQSIYQLRQQISAVLGAGEHSKLITTVPKRGYILNSEVLQSTKQPELTDKHRLHTPGRLRIAAIVLAVLTLLLVWIVLQWRTEQKFETPPSGHLSIAVLPFLPLVSENSDPALELGMADTLIARLSRIKQVIVRPINLVSRLKAVDRDSIQVGKDLKVDAIVEGSIQHQDKVIRVTVRLLRVADGVALWADTFDEPFSNIFELQDVICARIAEALALELGPEEQKELASAGTAQTDAYILYLKGRMHLFRLTPEDMLTSIEYFREAVELDPLYAQAWLGLASVQFRIPIAGEEPPLKHYPAAKAAALKALEIDSSLAEGEAMLGWIAHWFDWDWVASEAHFLRAIQIDPNDVESHLGYAHLLSSSGRFEQAKKEMWRARELNPFNPIAAALEVRFMLDLGLDDEAIRLGEQARNLNDKFWLIRVNLFDAYSNSGREEEALTELRVAQQLSGSNSYVEALLVGQLAKMGHELEAQQQLEELVIRANTTYVPPYNMALAYLGVGDMDTTMSWLQQGYMRRDPKMVFLELGEDWQVLRNRPDFIELLVRMNLPVVR